MTKLSELKDTIDKLVNDGYGDYYVCARSSIGHKEYVCADFDDWDVGELTEDCDWYYGEWLFVKYDFNEDSKRENAICLW